MVKVRVSPKYHFYVKVDPKTKFIYCNCNAFKTHRWCSHVFQALDTLLLNGEITREEYEVLLNRLRLRIGNTRPI